MGLLYIYGTYKYHIVFPDQLTVVTQDENYQPFVYGSLHFTIIVYFSYTTYLLPGEYGPFPKNNLLRRVDRNLICYELLISSLSLNLMLALKLSWNVRLYVPFPTDKVHHGYLLNIYKRHCHLGNLLRAARSCSRRSGFLQRATLSCVLGTWRSLTGRIDLLRPAHGGP